MMVRQQTPQHLQTNITLLDGRPQLITHVGKPRRIIRLLLILEY